MKIGMMWFDDSRRTLQQKIERAAQHYARKYGRPAGLCYVHPTDGLPEQVDGIRVEPLRTVMPNYLWMGQTEGASE